MIIAPGSTVPIIGQPEVPDWFLTMHVKCTCGHQFMLVGQVGAMRACEGQDCRRLYKISGLPVMQANGEPGLSPVVVSLDGGSFATGLAYGNLPPK